MLQMVIACELVGAGEGFDDINCAVMMVIIIVIILLLLLLLFYI